MDSEVPMDFSSFGKEDEEPQLGAVPATVSAVESPAVQLPSVPLVVNTPQPPPELGAESTVVTEPAAEPSCSTSVAPPVTQDPSVAPVADPSTAIPPAASPLAAVPAAAAPPAAVPAAAAPPAAAPPAAVPPAAAPPAAAPLAGLPVSADGAAGHSTAAPEQPGQTAPAAGSEGAGDQLAAGPASVEVAVMAAGGGLPQIPAVTEMVMEQKVTTEAAVEPVPRVTIEPVPKAAVEPVPVQIITIELVTEVVPESADSVQSSVPAATTSDPPPTVRAAPANTAASDAAANNPSNTPPVGTKVTDTNTGGTSISCSSGALTGRQEQAQPELIVPDMETLPTLLVEPQPQPEPQLKPEQMSLQTKPEQEPKKLEPEPALEPGTATGRRRIRQERARQEAAEPAPCPAPAVEPIPAPESTAEDVHCLVCNDPVGPGSGSGGLQLVDYLENAHIRIEDKLGSVINNDYRLYLHSEVVCDRCHTTLCQIHDLEMQTKHLKDQVVGFFWDTVEVRRVRPQRKGRRKSRPSKLLLESQETALFMPEVDIQEDPTDVIYKAPPKKIGRYSKPKCYEKLSHNEYQCIRCHKVLPRMRAVVKHFDLVHGPKEEQCDICEKYFRDRPHLDRHKQKVHPVVQLEDVLPEATEASSSSRVDASSAAAAAAAAGNSAAVTSDPATATGDPIVTSSATGDQASVLASAAAAVKQETVDISPDLSLPPDNELPPCDEEEDDDNDEDYIADRAPVIDDDDEDEDGEMEEVDMDVVMNVEVERPRRGRKRRHSSHSSTLGNEVGVMYTESADDSSPRFKCMLCPNTYSRAAKARDHFIAKHAQIKRFQCTICLEMFLTYKQKRHHELSHTAEVCAKCGKKYPGNKRGMLERHVAQCGELKKCRVCGAEFENVAEFIKHRRDAHEKSATCDVCGKIVSARNLASHRAIHSDERNYTCHLCGSSFKAKGSLDTHLRTHSEDRPFSCATCGRSFKHRNNWKDHERGHLNIRDFVCHFCSKSFKQAKNLKQHLRQHDANPEIFTCPHCPSTFRYKYNMLAHVKTLHTGEVSRRVRRRMRAPSELSASGSAGHPVLVGLDPLQLSPGSVTSDSNSGVHTVTGPAGTAAAAAAQGQQPAGSRSLPQLNPLNPGVVFMQTLQHHSIFSS